MRIGAGRIAGRGRSLVSAARQGAPLAREILDVAVEAGLASSSPVAAGVVVDPGSGVQEAVEDVTRRPHDDAGVSMPHDDVTRFGLRDALKAFDAVVQIIGVSIAVWETCALVDRMYKVGAIAFVESRGLRVERGGKDGKTFVGVQGLAFCMFLPGCLGRRSRSIRCGCGFLSPTGRQSHPADQERDRGSGMALHCPILMPIELLVVVTVVQALLTRVVIRA